jgi:hypothetical protein
MRLLATTILLASALVATGALAADPTLSDVTCAQLRENYTLTAEAQTRFSQLEGACEGVYEVNGARYVLVKAVYRGKKDGQTVLYLPATDRTIQMTPRPEARVLVDGRKVKPSALSRGDEVQIYLSVDKFTAAREMEEITFAAEDVAAPVVTESVAAAPVVDEPVQVAAALPTTASPLPLVAALSAGLLAVGGILRRSARKA